MNYIHYTLPARQADIPSHPVITGTGSKLRRADTASAGNNICEMKIRTVLQALSIQKTDGRAAFLYLFVVIIHKQCYPYIRLHAARQYRRL